MELCGSETFPELQSAGSEAQREAVSEPEPCQEEPCGLPSSPALFPSSAPPMTTPSVAPGNRELQQQRAGEAQSHARPPAKRARRRPLLTCSGKKKRPSDDPVKRCRGRARFSTFSQRHSKE
ncbi:hypothetical protein SKAU_G00267080 [Synaphobranchus kaupii]|uniref:Uncharacterized protein n=1 Tax=Synaphobranchus kaupii TaxID=118154 RepID=A0A9Q1IQ87_SYNKA|nr:hypothetical protein SKAU_G00267080 [Synaphobranchus kaupii]